MLKKALIVFLYTVFVAVVSALITTAYIQKFVMNNNGGNAEHQDLVQLSQSKAEKSPLKDDNTIIEFFSYGCHYCLAHEKDMDELKSRLPQGSKLVHMHISRPGSGLSRFDGVFATLSVMGIEERYREQAYNAVITNKTDLGNPEIRDTWLQSVGIDVNEYKKASESAEAKALLKYMADVTAYYDIRATPAFVVNKKWIALQDRKYPAFSDNLLSLLTQDKALEK